jgi:hypothetical protein
MHECAVSKYKLVNKYKSLAILKVTSFSLLSLLVLLLTMMLLLLLLLLLLMFSGWALCPSTKSDV